MTNDPIKDATERVNALCGAWEQFKQINDARLIEIERMGIADPAYKDHLSKINAALDSYSYRRSAIILETCNGILLDALRDIDEHSVPPFTGEKWHNYNNEVAAEAIAAVEKLMKEGAMVAPKKSAWIESELLPWLRDQEKTHNAGFQVEFTRIRNFIEGNREKWQ